MSPIYADEPETKLEMIPEARLWKRSVLFYYFEFINDYALYIEQGKDWSRKDKLQSSVVKLFLALRPKLNSEEMKGSLRQLEDYLTKSAKRYNPEVKSLTIKFIYDCFHPLQNALERLKITTPEREVLPLEQSCLEE